MQMQRDVIIDATNVSAGSASVTCKRNPWNGGTRYTAYRNLRVQP